MLYSYHILHIGISLGKKEDKLGIRASSTGTNLYIHIYILVVYIYILVVYIYSIYIIIHMHVLLYYMHVLYILLFIYA